MAKIVDATREQLKKSTLFCSEKNKENKFEKMQKKNSNISYNCKKIINRKIEITRIGYLAKIRKRKLEYVFLLNSLSFLCAKDKYA